jgi:hypothetical protein
MDEIIAGLTTPELRLLIDRMKREEDGRPTMPEQDAVWAMLEERAQAAGIPWP